ncbi:nitrous oxide reductase accessory protein NosL [Anoxybacteroides rupiense]|uniref:nitrous oxide reductase accessory protein NosL n=1 Tax=Anoxybacteroides rupiense TaxID=311460 RepID=UPI002896C76E|nr:nitrous oxide reductase accessory protein NosL [Anoxybacillus rupiensis]
MKKWFILFCASSIALAACGREESYKPKPINSDIDACEVCHMNIAAKNYATELLLKNGEVYKFDDIGCMVEFIQKKSIEATNIAATYVRDVQSGKWIRWENAFYVYIPDFPTPMSYGVVSFSTKKRAEAFISEQKQGTLLSFKELQQHKWGFVQ